MILQQQHLWRHKCVAGLCGMKRGMGRGVKASGILTRWNSTSALERGIPYVEYRQSVIRQEQYILKIFTTTIYDLYFRISHNLKDLSTCNLKIVFNKFIDDDDALVKFRCTHSKELLKQIWDVLLKVTLPSICPWPSALFNGRMDLRIRDLGLIASISKLYPIHASFAQLHRPVYFTILI